MNMIGFLASGIFNVAECGYPSDCASSQPFRIQVHFDSAQCALQHSSHAAVRVLARPNEALPWTCLNAECVTLDTS